jgi:NAD(P)-dependent dehydrogenase (short-subunit alcohol dehydrogenase family)
MQNLAGKIVVVTGAASGIGRALAQGFTREGARVVLSDVDAAGLTTLETELRNADAEVMAVETDVSDSISVEELARATLERFGGVDVLCNNAGVSTFNLLPDQSLDDWRWVIGVNLMGVIHGVHTFLPILLEGGREAHIVNTASIAGVLGGAGFMGPYAVTKSAVVSLSETLRVELGQMGAKVGVSVLCPGHTNTGIMEADRNRPMGPEARDSSVQEFCAKIKQTFTGETGLEPDAVASRVLSAVKENRFWVFTHPVMRPLVDARFREILEAY